MSKPHRSVSKQEGLPLPSTSSQGQLTPSELGTSLWSPPSPGMSGLGQMAAASPQAEATDPGAQFPSLLHAHPLANSSRPGQVLPWLRPPTVTRVSVPQPHREQELSSSQKHQEPAQGWMREGTGEVPSARTDVTPTSSTLLSCVWQTDSWHEPGPGLTGVDMKGRDLK